jgi:hypothetical protein
MLRISDNGKPLGWAAEPRECSYQHTAIGGCAAASWTSPDLGRETADDTRSKWYDTARYLIKDRDPAFDAGASPRMRWGLRKCSSAVDAAWQNPYVERLIDAIRSRIP